MDFVFFNVEIIRRLASTFVAIYSANSLPFGFLSRIKHPPLYIIKSLVPILRNKYKRVTFVRLD